LKLKLARLEREKKELEEANEKLQQKVHMTSYTSIQYSVEPRKNLQPGINLSKLTIVSENYLIYVK